MPITKWFAPVALLIAAPALAQQSADALWREASNYYAQSQSGSASTNPVVRAALLEKAVAAALQAEQSPGGAIPDFVKSRRDIQIALADAYVADKRWDRAALIFAAVKRDFATPPTDRQHAINFAHAVEGSFTVALGARDEPAMSRAVAMIDRLIAGRSANDIYINYFVSSVPKLLDHPDFNVTSSSQTRQTLALAIADSNHALSITRTFAAAFPNQSAQQNRLLGWLFRNGILRNDVSTLNEASDLAEQLEAKRRLEPGMTIVRDALRARCQQRRLGGQCDAQPVPH